MGKSPAQPLVTVTGENQLRVRGAGLLWGPRFPSRVRIAWDCKEGVSLTGLHTPPCTCNLKKVIPVKEELLCYKLGIAE